MSRSPLSGALPPDKAERRQREGSWNRAPNGAGDDDLADNVEWDDPIPLTREGALPRFPTELLPGWLANFVRAEAVATQTPEDLAGVLSLTAIATAAGGRVRVEARPGWDEPTNLYATVAMEPGTRKSPVFSSISRPLIEADKTLVRESVDKIREAELRKEVAQEGARQKAREAAADADKLEDALAAAAMAEACTVPTMPQLLTEDATPEALASLMQDQGGRIAILSDEGGFFGVLAGRYSSGAPNLELFLKAWSGAMPYRVDRRGRASEFIERPALTLGLTVQPEVLRSIARQPHWRGQGVLARILYAVPQSTLGNRAINPPRVPDGVRRAYEENLRAMVLSLAEWSEPVTIALSEEAHGELIAFETRIEPRLGAGGDLHHIADWASKLAGTAVRLAALIHLAAHLRDGWRRSVESASMRAAIGLADYFCAHAIAAFEAMGADPVTEDAGYALRWLAAQGRDRFTTRDLYKANRARFPTASDVEPVLERLKGLGWIHPLAQPSQQGPGRPASQLWALHPQVATRKNDKNNRIDVREPRRANSVHFVVSARSNGETHGVCIDPAPRATGSLLPVARQCDRCAEVTRRVGSEGRPRHLGCEPAGVL